MASLLIAMVVCGRQLYKAHQDHRSEKRERELHGYVPAPGKKKKKHHSHDHKSPRSTRRSRFLRRGRADPADDAPHPHSHDNTAPPRMEEEPRRPRMSDESTLAETRNDGDWTRRTR